MMEPTFAKLLVLLARSEVRFLLVGGLAVTLHGYSRLTEDVDILLESSPDNLGKFLATMATYGEGFASELTVEDFDEEEGAIRIVEASEFCQIDVFTRMNGSSYHDFVSEAASLVIGDSTVMYASKETLIELKAHSAREKDRLDVHALKQLQANPNAFR